MPCGCLPGGFQMIRRFVRLNAAALIAFVPLLLATSAEAGGFRLLSTHEPTIADIHAAIRSRVYRRPLARSVSRIQLRRATPSRCARCARRARWCWPSPIWRSSPEARSRRSVHSFRATRATPMRPTAYPRAQAAVRRRPLRRVSGRWGSGPTPAIPSAGPRPTRASSAFARPWG
jgi:hypothetical protein